jgi:hypothetical protein
LATAPLLDGLTVYSRLGDFFAIACAVTGAALIGRAALVR